MADPTRRCRWGVLTIGGGLRLLLILWLAVVMTQAVWAEEPLGESASEEEDTLESFSDSTPFDGQYETESGHALRKEQLTPVVYGGYPESGAYLLFAPWDYISFGGVVAVRYDPYFRLGGLVKVQMLESESKRFNLALSFQPGFGFNFKRNQNRLAWVHLEPGVQWGVRFAPGWTLFQQTSYTALLPFEREFTSVWVYDATQKEEGYYRKLYDPWSPVQSLNLALGLEVSIPRTMNLFAKGLVELTDFRPEDFIYGGQFGFSIPLWL